MAVLTPAGNQALKQKNFVSHTRIYINDALHIDTSVNVIDTPVIGYQINRSRKLGAAKLTLNVANPGGIYSFKRQENPILGHGSTIRLQEGIVVGQTIEWFTRFTGIIISQVASNNGGKMSLKVYAMDHMKRLLDYLPDDITYSPDMIAVKGEVLIEVEGGNLMHFQGAIENLPWVDIPYPIFYKDGVKIKENYEVDLINGEVFFGEKMTGRRKFDAVKAASTIYTISASVNPGFEVRRSFTLMNGGVPGQAFTDQALPRGVTVSYSGKQVVFSQDPFKDLGVEYVDRKIHVTTEGPSQVTADYWYYDDATNQGEQVIRDLAIKAGFKDEQIILDPTNLSLKPIRFTNLTIKNGFDALQKIKQQLSPNYIITCDTEGNLRGYHASQQVVADYDLELIKKIDAPISEESLYSVVVAHGLDLNPNDLGKTAVATNLLPPSSVIEVGGSPELVLNKSADDQMSWHWVQKNNDVPPDFPTDLLKITLAEAKKIEEINILCGDYKGGTIQQSISVQVSEDGDNWFYIDRSSRGVSGSSSQWSTVNGGELEKRKIKHIKLIAEASSDWVETHTYSKRSGFLGLKTSVKSDNYYHWYFAVKEVQIWEENTIPVTSSVGNCIGIGNGVNTIFTIPNIPLEEGSVSLYIDGQLKAAQFYTVDYTSGQVIFITPPVGIITANYTAETKKQPRYQSNQSDRYLNNVTLISPVNREVFSGGDISIDSAAYKLLKKIGLKKTALKIDNYLNSVSDVKKRGEEILQEISRLEETLDIDVIYRPDVDICQTIGVFDAALGLTEMYFIEEITESKQGYRPTLNIKVSNYSL
ncbi:MAG: hypothetical protein K0Q75_130 [Anaerospora sp.]|jgi:hypothetical protein|nr:hypothetical protein [Anaerospora sp.]